MAWAANPSRIMSEADEESAQIGAELIAQALSSFNRFDQAFLKAERG